MKHRTAIGLATALLLACFTHFAAAAEQPEDEISLLKAQVAALSARLNELEAREQQTAVRSENLAQPVQAAAITQASAGATEWAQRVKLKGDLRYRHEMIDEDGSSDRTRHRIRARLGLQAQVTDDLDTFLQLATGGSDARSTNQTLGDGFSSKSVAFDLAYFQWSVTESIDLLGGKMKNPIRTPRGNRFIDGDITPEGLALNWSNGDFFLLGSGFWGAERSSDDDAVALILQGGYSTKLNNGMNLTAAVSYTDWSNLKGYAPGNTGSVWSVL